MSHIATVSLAGKFQDQKNICNTLNEQIFGITAELTSTTQKQINKFTNQLKTSIEEIEKLDKETISGDADHVYDLVAEKQFTVSSLIKRSANLINNIDFINNAIELADKDNKESIATLIQENGEMAVQAIEILKTRGQNISINAVEVLIEEIRNDKSSNNSQKRFIEKAEKLINATRFSDHIKYYLFSFAKKQNTPQLMADFDAYLKEKEVNAINMTKIFNNEIIKASGMELRKWKFVISKDGELVIRASIEDSNTGQINLQFTEELRVKYQMGNYKGHMCHQVAKKWFAAIEKERKITDKKLIRDFSNEQPLAKMYKRNTGRRSK